MPRPSDAPIANSEKPATNNGAGLSRTLTGRAGNGSTSDNAAERLTASSTRAMPGNPARPSSGLMAKVAPRRSDSRNTVASQETLNSGSADKTMSESPAQNMAGMDDHSWVENWISFRN